jgi:DHA3 family macrolide efflux protein-like MFS transporter
MINRNFTLIWLGKFISQLGDKFYAIALAWWILQKTNSPSVMGFFLLTSILPGLLLGLFAGALTDRWQRKTMLIITDISRGCLVLIIVYISFQGILQVWHVFLIGISLSLVTAFFDPAVQAIILEIVASENLKQANGLSQMVSGICTVIGPMLGVVAVSVLGLTWVFLLNGVSYFISALLASFVITNKANYKSNPSPNIWRDMGIGIAFIKICPTIILILKIIATTHLLMGILTVSLPFLAKGLVGDGVKNLGYLQMMMGVGLIAGSLLLSISKKNMIMEQKLIQIIAIIGVCFIVISTGQRYRIDTVIFYMIIMSVIGVCISWAAVFWQSLLQRYTPVELTGRVFSISTLLGNASLPLAYGVFGILLKISSIALLTSISGICLLVFCGYLYLSAKTNCNAEAKQKSPKIDGVS